MYNGYHSASASNRRDEEAAKVILPVALLVAIGASRVFFVRRFRTKVNAERAFMARGLVDGLVAIGCRIFRPFSMPSIVPYWDLSTRIITWMVMSRWVPKESDKHLTIRQAFLNGPLGLGASKVVQVVVAIFLWRIMNKDWPPIRFFGNKYPGLWEWIILFGICSGVNIALFAWSRIARSRGKHDGVQRMVASSRGRETLTRGEMLLYGCLAFVNATCEEVNFRWFWKAEFAAYLSARDANIAQAAVFGTLHYYGIPSGLSGVILTFCYGWIMGLVMDHFSGGGLFLPIVAHSIADHYIFASVARSKRVTARCNGTGGAKQSSAMGKKINIVVAW